MILELQFKPAGIGDGAVFVNMVLPIIEAVSEVRGVDYDPALDLAQAIEQLQLELPIVMGHSLGARSTARYASTQINGAGHNIRRENFDDYILAVCNLLRDMR